MKAIRVKRGASLKSNNSHISEIKKNGISISNSQDLSETFNDHFATIGPKLAKEIPLNVNDRSHLDYLRGLPSDHLPFQLNRPTNIAPKSSLCYLGLANPKQPD